MAVSQSQVDHIIASASSDDPEVKLLKLQDEVELIKTSIKRLLIDIRERMNDLENPIVVSGKGDQGGEVASRMANVMKDTSSALESAAEAIKSTSQIQQKGASEGGAAGAEPKTPAADQPRPQGQEGLHGIPGHPAPGSTPAGVSAGHEVAKSEADLLAALKSQLAILPKEEDSARTAAGDKVRLQKVFRLFEWTSRNVKRYGHDRVDLMLEAYHAMGYISDKSCKLVKDMARLMPTSIGELHEIRADEFVSELYELNHILNPSDSTLDRDMIEVLMEKRETRDTQKFLASGQHPEEESKKREYLPSRDRL
ncbi:MAG: hypothetical protein NQU46_04415 [Methanolinea sp.]|nr:hypothetical protein [Methanolinea sp.]